MKRLIMLLVTCIMITGCSVTKTQETIEKVDKTPIQEEQTDELAVDDVFETVEEMPILDKVDEDIVGEELQIQPLEIIISTLENQYKEEDALLAHVKIEYPIIQNTLDDEGLTKINEFFEESAQALYEENDTYARDNVESFKEEALFDKNSQACYSEYVVAVKIEYNANGYLSVLEKFSENYYGMDNPNTYSTGYVFDIKTGERLAINDILRGTDDEIAQIIGKRFINSDRISEEVKTKYQEEILNNTQYVGFYIDDNNINFFYDPFTVAPYAEGSLEAYLPLNTQDVFKLNIEQID